MLTVQRDSRAKLLVVQRYWEQRLNYMTITRLRLLEGNSRGIFDIDFGDGYTG